MSDREQLLLDFVLESVANGYESFDCVVQQVMKWSAERALSATRDELADALGKVIREGYVQAYVLSPHQPYSEAVEFCPDDLNDLWFYVTPKGRHRVEQLSGGPDADRN